MTPALRVPQVVNVRALESAIRDVVPHPQLRQAMMHALQEMLQQVGPGFKLLQGGCRPALRATTCPASSASWPIA